MSVPAWIARHRYWLIVVLAGVAAGLIGVLAYIADLEARKGAGAAIVGGAIDIVFVGLIGGVVTAAVKEQLATQAEARQKEAVEAENRRRLNEYRLRLLLDVVSAYNLTKGARRALRAAGFLEPASATLEAWQIDEYRKQLSTINEAQLQIEKIERELKVDLGQLTRHAEVQGGIEAAKKYLEEIVRGWENESAGVERGEVASVTRQAALVHFLSTTKDHEHFRVGMSAHLDMVERAIRDDMKAGTGSDVRM
jgi:hypothetical protein